MIMKKLKDITVTYRVGLGNIDVSDEIYQALIDSQGMTLRHDDNKAKQVACSWLSDNIQEADCFDWKCEIDDLE